ncbi:peptidoglycan-binding domain-containing protein [Streptomyces sp. NPDC001868]|uniref:peptidoglycan-binding domain-containing protein n=1 Tax=Streptomyces sp. NPDC001868 TaxID=3154401 RepID=UPI0033180F08
MSEPTSHICPECSTPRASDGTPSCACGRRASEALLEARTAEAAAAEDFDPLRIRPYVELGGDPDPRTPAPDRASTIAMPMTTATTATTATGTGTTSGTDTWMFDRGAGERDGGGAGTGAAPSAEHSGRRRRRRRRTGLVVALAGTAVAGVMAAAGIASGLFSYDAPERDRALPDDLRASAPDTSPDGEASPVERSGQGGGGEPAPAPPGGGGASSPRPTKSASPSPSPSQSSGSPSASASADPTQSAPSASASTGSSAADADDTDEADNSRLVPPQTLRLGDDDPEVTELQLRLGELGYYEGDIDESFDSQVEQAVRRYQKDRGITAKEEEPGVYGPVTRERLESQTKEP